MDAAKESVNATQIIASHLAPRPYSESTTQLPGDSFDRSLWTIRSDQGPLIGPTNSIGVYTGDLPQA